MKNQLLYSLFVLILAGCGPSYRSTPLRHPVKADDRIAVEKFLADSPADAQMIRETLVVELKEAGLAVVDVNDSPDLIISGTITSGKGEFSLEYTESVILIVKTTADNFVMSFQCNQDSLSAKAIGKIGTQLGKRIAKKLKKK